jgi:hypothetical protein
MNNTIMEKQNDINKSDGNSVMGSPKVKIDTQSSFN